MVETRGEEVHLDKQEARSGSTPHVVRYVLIISLFLAVIALSAIWITGALTTDADAQAAATNGESAPALTGRAA